MGAVRHKGYDNGRVEAERGIEMTTIPIIDGEWTCPDCLRTCTDVDEGEVILLVCPHCGSEFEGELK
jgi:rubredoxin